MAILISSTNRPAYLDAATQSVWHPQQLPDPVQRAFEVRDDILALTTQHGDIEENADIVSLQVLLKSGVLVVYELCRCEFTTPCVFDLDVPGCPHSVTVWADDTLVFALEWNARGVFQLHLHRKGPWRKMIRKALARPDLHLI